jgi:hypothetical protein
VLPALNARCARPATALAHPHDCRAPFCCHALAPPPPPPPPLRRLKDGISDWEQKQFGAEMELVITRSICSVECSVRCTVVFCVLHSGVSRAIRTGFLVAALFGADSATGNHTFHLQLCRVSHVSICRLLAFSEDGPSRCLVLELCTGGALDTRLACKPPAPAPLGWQTRVHIALGVARALDHLHGLTPQMIHRQESRPLLPQHSLHTQIRTHSLQAREPPTSADSRSLPHWLPSSHQPTET